MDVGAGKGEFVADGAGATVAGCCGAVVVCATTGGFVRTTVGAGVDDEHADRMINKQTNTARRDGLNTGRSFKPLRG